MTELTHKETLRLTRHASNIWGKILRSHQPMKYINHLKRIDEERDREGIIPECGMTEMQIFSDLYL